MSIDGGVMNLIYYQLKCDSEDEMNMKKVISTMLLLVLLSTLLTGCNSTVDEKQIQEDLEADSQFDFLKDNEKIEKLVIEKRQTEKEQKVDTIWCTITTADTEISYQKDAVLTYGLYDKGGWILDDISINEIIKTPLKGVSEEKISSSLKGQFITINDERWDIGEDNLKSISIDSQNTNLEECIDIVTVSITLDEEVEEASGKLEINYNFDDEWKIDNILEIEEFKTTVKPEKALDVTGENLIDEINGQEFSYGESKTGNGNGISFTNYNSQQTITINKSEISDLVIENQISSSKGMCQEFDCRFTLMKQSVVFDIQAQIRYLYDSNNGWGFDSVTILPEVSSVNIEGDWKGTYVVAGDNGEVVLKITSTDESGNINGIYSWTSSKQAGSYYVSGTIDKDTLRLNMTAGEWIDKPSNAMFVTKVDIRAILYADDSEMEGIGHQSASFKVSQ